MNRKIMKNRGLTLIELALTISITTIVLLLAFSFLQFNYTTLNRSNAKYNLMTNLYYAQMIIEKELKYADTFVIKTDGNIEDEKSYLYLKDGQIFMKQLGKEYTVTDNSLAIIMELKFNLKGSLLQVIIEGKSPDGSFEHSINYNMELLNIQGKSEDSEGNIVEYSTYKGDD